MIFVFSSITNMLKHGGQASESGRHMRWLRGPIGRSMRNALKALLTSGLAITIPVLTLAFFSSKIEVSSGGVASEFRAVANGFAAINEQISGRDFGTKYLNKSEITSVIFQFITPQSERLRQVIESNKEIQFNVGLLDERDQAQFKRLIEYIIADSNIIEKLFNSNYLNYASIYYLIGKITKDAEDSAWAMAKLIERAEVGLLSPSEQRSFFLARADFSKKIGYIFVISGNLEKMISSPSSTLP
jgi:hypothetical protein